MRSWWHNCIINKKQLSTFSFFKAVAKHWLREAEETSLFSFICFFFHLFLNKIFIVARERKKYCHDKIIINIVIIIMIYISAIILRFNINGKLRIFVITINNIYLPSSDPILFCSCSPKGFLNMNTCSATPVATLVSMNQHENDVNIINTYVVIMFTSFLCSMITMKQCLGCHTCE